MSSAVPIARGQDWQTCSRHAAPWRAQGCGTDGAAPWKPDTTYLRNYRSRPGKCLVDVFAWSTFLVDKSFMMSWHVQFTFFVWTTFILMRCYARSTNSCVRVNIWAPLCQKYELLESSCVGQISWHFGALEFTFFRADKHLSGTLLYHKYELS